MSGILWATLNRTLSVKDGQKQKAMGLKKGAPDLFVFRDNTLFGAELKAQKQKHNREHIRQQIKFGKQLIEQGGKYRFITTLEDFYLFLNGYETKYTIEYVEANMLNKTTVIFE